MTIDQVIAAEKADREAFEAKTVATTIGGVDYTIADLRKAFDAVADPDDWKAEFTAYVPHDAVPVVLAAVEFFHADRPAVVGIEPAPGLGRAVVSGHGYQA